MERRKEKSCLAKTGFRCGLLAVLALVALVTVAQADEHAAQHHGEATADDHPHDVAEAHHHGHVAANEVGLVFGITKEPHHDGQFTVGAEYEHRFSKRWGVGAFVDFAGGDLRNYLFGLVACYHPLDHVRLHAGPALEFHNGRGGITHDEHGDAVVDEDETFFVLRVGAAYSFHFNEHWGVAPTVSADFVDGETVWVYGASLNYGW
jgi:hypothetical protein